VKQSSAPARRKFLIDIARGATVGGAFALGLAGYARQSNALPATAIRPPGALQEDDFLSACIRCGLCVNDCPYPTLSLATIGDKVTIGTPFFVAREAACEMCEDIPCVKACPTGALDHDLTDIDDARMGLAAIIDQESCIAFQGLRCEVCFNVCPIRGEAITVEMEHLERTGKHSRFIPVVHSDSCTGCGKCEQACILEEAAVKVLPFDLAKGEMQAHYKLGWDEKGQAGESLVPLDTEHQYNLPEGLRYDYEGQGLIEEKGQQAPLGNSPFAADPLATLNNRATD